MGVERSRWYLFAAPVVPVVGECLVGAWDAADAVRQRLQVMGRGYDALACDVADEQRQVVEVEVASCVGGRHASAADDGGELASVVVLDGLDEVAVA